MSCNVSVLDLKLKSDQNFAIYLLSLLLMGSRWEENSGKVGSGVSRHD